MEKKGLIVVVNYNQAREIGRFLTELSGFLRGQALGLDVVLDVVLVDDGSSDDSAGIAEGMGFRVFRHGRNIGIGAAIRTGLMHGIEKGYAYAVIMSSNGKMKCRDLPRVALPVAEGRVDYTQGSRFLAEGASIQLSRFRRAMIPVFTLVANTVLGRSFSDITCGFRAYRLDLFRDHPEINLAQEWLNRYEMEFYIHYWACKLRYRIEEVPVTIDYSHLEKGRKSKIVPIFGWWSMARPFVFLALGLKK